MSVEKVLFPLTLVTALGCGLIAGVFFAFSSFVMRALARLPVPEGIAAMQSINIVVLNPLFLGVFVGTTAACGLVAVLALFQWHNPASVYRVIGGALYVIGTFMVTGVCNVPLNDKLGAVKPSHPDAALVWANYLSQWTMWNHVRTVMALAAATSLTIALYRQATQS